MAQFGTDKKDHISRKQPATMGKFIINGGDEFRFTVLDAIQTFKVPMSLREVVFDYRLTPAGTEPAYIRYLKKAYYMSQANIAAAHAKSNYESIMQYLTLSTEEIFNMRNEAINSIGMLDVLPKGLKSTQLELQKKNNRAAKYMLKIMEDFEIDAIDAKIITVDDPRFLDPSMQNKSFDSLPMRMRQRGGLRQTRNGAWVYYTHGALGQQSAEDSDGDVKSLIRFMNKKGGKNFAIGIKNPNYRRHGIIELQDITNYSITESFNKGSRPLFDYTPDRAQPADLLRVTNEDINQIVERKGFMSQRNEVKQFLKAAEQVRGGRPATHISNYDEVSSLVADEIIAATTKSSGAGMLNNAVKTQDIYKAARALGLESLGEKEIENLTAKALFDFVNQGDDWFTIQEVQGLKKTGATGTNIEDISPMKLTGLLKEYLTNTKNHSNFTYDQRLRLLQELAKRQGLDLQNPDTMEAVMELHTDYLLKPLTAMAKDETSFEERYPTSEKYQIKKARERAAGSHLKRALKYNKKKAANGIFTALESSGIIELRDLDINSHKLGLTEEVLKARGTIRAFLTSDMEGKMSGTLNSVSPEGVTKAEMVGNIIFVDAKEQTHLIRGDQALRAYVDERVGEHILTTKIKKKVVKHQFGKISKTAEDGVLSIDMIAKDQNVRKRIAADLVRDGKDLYLPGYSVSASIPKETRVENLANHIGRLAEKGDISKLEKLIVRWDLSSSSGKTIYREVLNATKEFMSMYGDSGDIVVDSTRTALFTNRASAAQNVGYIPIASEIESVTTDDYFRVHARAAGVTDLSLTVKDSGHAHTYKAAIADRTGAPAIGSGHGTKHSRMSKSRSQLTGVAIRARTGIIAPDWDSIGITDVNQTAADVWRQQTEFELDSAGKMISKEKDLGRLTNLVRTTGAGQSYASQSLYDKINKARQLASSGLKTFDASLSNKDLIDLGFDPADISEHERMSITGTIKRFKGMPAKDQEIAFTKLLDRFGTTKIMADPINKITAIAGNQRVNIDFLMDAAEVNQKYKTMIGFIVDTAVQKYEGKMSPAEIQQIVLKVFEEAKEIIDRGGSQSDIAQAVNQKIDNLLGWSGLHKAEFELEDRGIITKVAGYVRDFEVDIVASQSPTETNYHLSEPKLGIKTGFQSQEYLDKILASQVTDLAAKLAEEEGVTLSAQELAEAHSVMFNKLNKAREAILSNKLQGVEAAEAFNTALREALYEQTNTGSKAAGANAGNVNAQAAKNPLNPIAQAMKTPALNLAKFAAPAAAAVALAQILKFSKDEEKKKYKSIR